jgi:hypothetical protein
MKQQQRWPVTGSLFALWAAGLILVGCARQAPGSRAMVAGGDAGGIPRAQPADEHLDAAALEQVSRDPVARGLLVFVVMRHGHVVFDRYAHGMGADSDAPVDGFAPVLPALLAGVAVSNDLFPFPPRSAFEPNQIRGRIESAAHQPYPDFLSTQLWRPLNAAPAWIALQAGTPTPADCCFHARVLDWLRVADLLVEDGRFEDRQVVPTGWVARMRQPLTSDGSRGMGVLLAPAAQGAEAFELPQETFFLRAAGHWRLWLIPSERLVVLFGAAVDTDSATAHTWDETRLPNMVVRALSEPIKGNDAASKLQQLVPGH